MTKSRRGVEEEAAMRGLCKTEPVSCRLGGGLSKALGAQSPIGGISMGGGLGMGLGSWGTSPGFQGGASEGKSG